MSISRYGLMISYGDMGYVSVALWTHGDAIAEVGTEYSQACRSFLRRRRWCSFVGVEVADVVRCVNDALKDVERRAANVRK